MLKTINPLEHIRAHPELYFSTGHPDPSELATRLAADALSLNASRTIAIHQGPIWAVAADVDWLASAPVPIQSLFERIVPFPQSGVNSMRSEVLIAAFAQYVETWCGEEHHLLKGAQRDTLKISSLLPGEWKRVIIFSLESSAMSNEPLVSIAGRS